MADSGKKADIKAVLDYVQKQRDQYSLDGVVPEGAAVQILLTVGLEHYWQSPAAQESQERIRDIFRKLVEEWGRVEEQVQADYDNAGGDSPEE